MMTSPPWVHGGLFCNLKLYENNIFTTAILFSSGIKYGERAIVHTDAHCKCVWTAVISSLVGEWSTRKSISISRI